MSLLNIEKENAHIIINIFGKIKIKLKNPFIDRLRDCCCINNLRLLLDKGTSFVHPVGIVIHPEAKIGKNCLIYQNVTIGSGKCNPETNSSVPIIGDNVILYANSVVVGGITVGNSAIIGAGSVVTKDVPQNAVVVGNPAKILRYREEKE